MSTKHAVLATLLFAASSTACALDDAELAPETLTEAEAEVGGNDGTCAAGVLVALSMTVSPVAGQYNTLNLRVRNNGGTCSGRPKATVIPATGALFTANDNPLEILPGGATKTVKIFLPRFFSLSAGANACIKGSCASYVP